MIIGDIKTAITSYCGRNTVNDLTLNSQDAGLLAINTARRKIERAHDFRYARVDATLAVGANGGEITDAYLSSSVVVTGTLSPNIATTFALTGTYNSAPFYTATVSSVVYFLFFTGTAWQIRPGGFSGSNGWNRTTTSLEAAGTFTATGSSTGTATVTGSTAALSIKRVIGVELPVAASNYIPIEFLTIEQWNTRVARQIGRTTYAVGNTIAALGVSNTNPVAYQRGKTIFIAGSGTFSYPVSAKLDVYRFMPDYSADADHDFFCDYAPEYLIWQGVLELNKFFRRFIPKQESNVDEGSVQKLVDEAMQTLLAWDQSVSAGTTEAPAPPAPEK